MQQLFIYYLLYLDSLQMQYGVAAIISVRFRENNFVNVWFRHGIDKITLSHCDFA